MKYHIYRAFVSAKDSVTSINGKYLELFQSLYSQHPQTLTAYLKCGNFITSRCPRPVKVTISVEVSRYNQPVADKINENRIRREDGVRQILSTADNTAFHCAQLEYISRWIKNEYYHYYKHFIFSTLCSIWLKLEEDQAKLIGINLYNFLVSDIYSLNALVFIDFVLHLPITSDSARYSQPWSIHIMPVLTALGRSGLLFHKFIFLPRFRHLWRTLQRNKCI